MIPASPRTGDLSDTKVVNQALCESSLPAEQMVGKDTLEEVHTYAELELDPHASLPDSFTICSAIITTSCRNSPWPAFFTILDKSRSLLLAPMLVHNSVVNSLKIFYLQGASEEAVGKIPPMFPNLWIKCYMAVNISSGLIHWVVEGTHVLTTKSEQVKIQKVIRELLETPC